MSRRIFAVLLCVAALASSGHASTASDIAKKAQDAEKHVSYRGLKTASVCLNGKVTTSVVKIVHLQPDMTRKEYFSPSSLAGILLIQNGPDVWRYRPQEHAWEQVHSAAMGCCANGEWAFGNYDIQLVGTEKIAGRDAYLIRAIPRGAPEAMHRIWVDKTCYLTLGTQTETVGGGILSSSRFTTIEVNPKDISRTAFAVNGKVKSDARPAHIDFDIEKPSYLPKGYRMVGVVCLNANCHCFAHLQFSNGVNTISLFERRANVQVQAPQVPEKLKSMVTWTRNGMLFTLIGDLPRSELQKIADSTK